MTRSNSFKSRPTQFIYFGMYEVLPGLFAVGPADDDTITKLLSPKKGDGLIQTIGFTTNYPEIGPVTMVFILPQDERLSIAIASDIIDKYMDVFNEENPPNDKSHLN